MNTYYEFSSKKWYQDIPGGGWKRGGFKTVKEVGGGSYGVLYIEDAEVAGGMTEREAGRNVDAWAKNPKTAPFDGTWKNDWTGITAGVK